MVKRATEMRSMRAFRRAVECLDRVFKQCLVRARGQPLPRPPLCCMGVGVCGKT